MSNGRNNAVGATKEIFESTKGGAERAVSSARSHLFEAAELPIGAVGALRALGLDDVLGWVGLMRKRSPIGTVAAFGAGVAVGAGVGVLFAPMSGEELRRAMARRFYGWKDEASNELDKAGSEIKELEHKVEKKLGDAADAAKCTVDAAAGAVKKATEGADIRTGAFPKDSGSSPPTRGAGYKPAEPAGRGDRGNSLS